MSRWLIICWITLALTACAARGRRTGLLPAPVESSTLGPGDRFDVVIVREDKFHKDYTVAPDGSVDFPMIKRQIVTGMEPQVLAMQLRKLLMEGGYLSDPTVIVSVREFNSKRVTVGGAVTKPGEVPFTPGLSLLRLISNAGGFGLTANRDNVLVTRQLPNGERKTVSFSVEDIAEGRSADVPLQAGDAVYVYERAF